MKYFYCDSCFLITCYQKNYFAILSQHKNELFISHSQVEDELFKPSDLKDKVINSITIISENNNIIMKALELKPRHKGLSYYDCLCLAFAMIDVYTLISDDKALVNSAKKYGINTVGCEEIIELLKT